MNDWVAKAVGPPNRREAGGGGRTARSRRSQSVERQRDRYRGKLHKVLQKIFGRIRRLMDAVFTSASTTLYRGP